MVITQSFFPEGLGGGTGRVCFGLEDCDDESPFSTCPEPCLLGIRLLFCLRGLGGVGAGFALTSSSSSKSPMEKFLSMLTGLSLPRPASKSAWLSEWTRPSSVCISVDGLSAPSSNSRYGLSSCGLLQHHRGSEALASRMSHPCCLEMSCKALVELKPLAELVTYV
jgi:hypothetical protein